MTILTYVAIAPRTFVLFTSFALTFLVVSTVSVGFFGHLYTPAVVFAALVRDAVVLLFNVAVAILFLITFATTDALVDVVANSVTSNFAPADTFAFGLVTSTVLLTAFLVIII